MIVHSKDYVTNLDEVSIQPNAVDIRVNSLSLIVATDISIGETSKQFVERTPVPIKVDRDSGTEYWVLPPRSSFEFLTPHSVTVPEGACGWIVPRSTLARNGFLIGNGLYDSGYSGIIAGTLHNISDATVSLEVNVRIAQFIMAKAESAHLYDGYYNKNGGYSA